MGSRKSKNIKQRLCEITYLNRGLNRWLCCIHRSLLEVSKVLNAKD